MDTKKEKNMIAKMRKNKKGYFFSIDAFVALLIILGVVLFIKPSQKNLTFESSVDEDLINVLSNLKVGEIDNTYVQGLMSSGNITDLNKSVLDQIGEFYAVSSPLAPMLAQNVLDSISLQENVALYFDNQLIASRSVLPYSNSSRIFTSRQIISGISNLSGAATGYSSRAYLFSKSLVYYSYFGGYVGDGNITALVVKTAPQAILNVDIEGVFSSPFNIYINGFPQRYGNGSIVKHDSLQGIPYKTNLGPWIDNFNLLYNNITFTSTNGSSLYIAGGFVKIVYNQTSGFMNLKNIPGIKGLVNIYDSFYAPEAVQGINVYLDYNSSYDMFMTIGNTEVYRGNSNGTPTTVFLDSATIESKGVNFASLSKKTVPYRIGLVNVSYALNQSIGVDAISVSDLSGSMGGQKIANAKAANIELVDALLNYSENNVGLAGYFTFAKKSDFHPLSNDNTSLKNEINSWNAQGYTCICCGILKAINCFDKNVFSDNFNGQTPGTNPIGWALIEGNGAVDITSSSLEGDRAVNIARLFSQNPLLNHYFAPQQDSITIEFLVKQNSGSGRVRIEIEETNEGYTSFNDYIIIKMYNGWIRNNDAQVLAYNLNTIYKIKIEVVPGASTYDLYVNDALVGNDLPVYITRNDVTRISFTTESSNVNYTIDDTKVFLTNEICSVPTGERKRFAVVMTDGIANRGCGLDPVPDYNGNGDTTIDDESDQAVEAACIAKQKHNITVYAIAFGNGADTNTTNAIASCGEGSSYVGDISNIVDIYTNISQKIIQAAYSEQTIFTGGNVITSINPDSYIQVIYAPTTPPPGLLITSETPRFNNNISQGTFYIPNDTQIYSARVVSYSGSKWTSIVDVYNNTTGAYDKIFDLSDYGSNFTQLGDPYAVEIPTSNLVYGNNTVRVRLGLSSSQFAGGSPENKIIYTLIKNVSGFSPILSSAEGCLWEIEFEDSTLSLINAPYNYTGPDRCYYNSLITSGPFEYAQFNPNDAIDYSVYLLFKELDLNKNGKIESKITEQDLAIASDPVSDIPFTWETEVQTRVWY